MQIDSLTLWAALRRGPVRWLGLPALLVLGSTACRDALSQSHRPETVEASQAQSQVQAPTSEVELGRTFDSPQALAEAILEAFAAEDVGALKSYPLSKEEFRRHVWPSLPSARPERNVPFDYAWGDLHQKSTNALRRSYSKYAGRRFELLDVDFAGESSDYGSYFVHRDARVHVRDVLGEDFEIDLFGSVLEWNGRYKLFSYVTD